MGIHWGIQQYQIVLESMKNFLQSNILLFFMENYVLSALTNSRRLMCYDCSEISSEPNNVCSTNPGRLRTAEESDFLKLLNINIFLFILFMGKCKISY